VRERGGLSASLNGNTTQQGGVPMQGVSFFGRRFWLVTIFAVLLTQVVGAEEDVRILSRKPWYIGFGVGSGVGAAWTIDGQEITFDEWFDGMETVSPKISINFKVGATVTPRLLLGLDLTGLAQMADDPIGTAMLQISNVYGMATYFPFKKGLFLRGGGGYSSFTADVVTPMGSGSSEADGYGFLGGIGYAFWLGKRFNLTLNADHARQYYSGANNPHESWYTSLYVGFDWY
jgi:hypothetical protein